VADDAPNNPGPFDVRTIKVLVQLMARHDLSEIDLRDGALRVRLLRGPSAAPAGYAPVAPLPAAPAHPAPAAPSREPPAPARKLLEIKSPSVGTFYAAANPEAPPFVRVGDRVTPTTVVGLIEAMKLFNEVQAECSGVIAEVVAQNQQAVEFGEVLFRVDPAG
jgi:acetyl-CoA carboxylase biotin carboxyl carrier protein